MANKLFRQQAMDTLESPDKISDYIRVTRPSFYLWLVSILVCVVSIAIWAFNSQVSDFVKISGIAFPHEEIKQVTAPLDGRITEVLVKKGNSVKPGDILYRYATGTAERELRSNGSGVVLSHMVEQEEFKALQPCVWLLPHEQVNQLKEVIAFVTYQHLRKLKVGMEVQVTPADLKREEVGYMYGHITAIDELPTSSKEAGQLFKLEEFATAVLPEEPSFMVKIRLEDDRHNASKIRWSHQQDKEINIKIGTFCNLQIVTRNRPVFDLLFNREDK